MKIRNSICTILLSLAPFAVIADNPDVENFELSGVKLGMSVQEAKDALVTHYSISADDFFVQMFPDRLPMLGNMEMIDSIEYESAELSLIMLFIPDMDRKDDGYMVLDEIEIYDERTSYEEKLDIARGEYGPETFTWQGQRHHWCGKVRDDGKACDYKFGTLELDGQGMLFVTDSYQKKFDEAAHQYRQQNQ